MKDFIFIMILYKIKNYNTQYILSIFKIKLISNTRNITLKINDQVY
jgi:hypothetical protein